MSRRKRQSTTPEKDTEPGIWTPDAILQNHKQLTWREIIFASQVHFHQQYSPDGICRASIRNFAKKLNLPRRNIESIENEMVEKGLLKREIKREPGKNPWTELKLTDKCYLNGQSVTEIQTPPPVTEKQTPPVTRKQTQVSLGSRHLNYNNNINTPDGVDTPKGESNSFLASVSQGSTHKKRAARETATSYTTTPAFDEFWERVRFSKGDRFPAWQTWQRLGIEGKGLAGRVMAALKAAVVEWQRRDAQYRPRVAKWLADATWMNNGQDDEARPKKSLEWPDPPAEVIAEDFRRAREASL